MRVFSSVGTAVSSEQFGPIGLVLGTLIVTVPVDEYSSTRKLMTLTIVILINTY